MRAASHECKCVFGRTAKKGNLRVELKRAKLRWILNGYSNRRDAIDAEHAVRGELWVYRVSSAESHAANTGGRARV